LSGPTGNAENNSDQDLVSMNKTIGKEIAQVSNKSTASSEVVKVDFNKASFQQSQPLISMVFCYISK
jgi:hypothetical protein